MKIRFQDIEAALAEAGFPSRVVGREIWDREPRTVLSAIYTLPWHYARTPPRWECRREISRRELLCMDEREKWLWAKRFIDECVTEFKSFPLRAMCSILAIDETRGRELIEIRRRSKENEMATWRNTGNIDAMKFTQRHVISDEEGVILDYEDTIRAERNMAAWAQRSHELSVIPHMPEVPAEMLLDQ